MSPRSAAANQQLKDERRGAILDAARRVFARGGLTGTRIGDIAAEARVSQGLLYHYFPNKEALFTEIVEGALKETASLTARAANPAGSAWERLQRLCEQMLAGVLEQPDYVLVVLQAFTSDAVPEPARAALRLYGQRSFRDLVSLVRQAQQEGRVVAGDPVELVLAYNACIQGVALSVLQSGARRGRLPSVDTVLRLLRA